MKRTLRRIASWLCVLTLCLSLLPSTAWAATSMSPRNVLFEYNWFTESWDVVSFQSPEGIAFNEIVNKIELRLNTMVIHGIGMAAVSCS